LPSYDYSKTGLTTRIIQLVGGQPGYLLGSFNSLVSPTKMNISTVALSGTTATITGLVISGNIPVVGQLVSISGAVPAYFNVTNAPILSVSAAASPDLGVYTITFALTNSGIGTTVSPGVAVAPQLEVGDPLVAESSMAGALQSNFPVYQGRSIRFDVTFPVIPGAALVQAQSAMIDIDADYQNLGTAASVVGGVVQGSNTNGPNTSSVIFTGVTANFVRFNIPQSGLAGYGSATIVGKVLI
jgi:hypothetical protein